MKAIFSLVTALALALSVQAQELSQRLLIDANEDQLTATLTYHGARVDIFGHADDLVLDQGRLAISVIGPESPQELRMMRRAFGLVTQGPAETFEHLPGFWSLHATPPPLLSAAAGGSTNANASDFDQLPAQLQTWAFNASQAWKSDTALGDSAIEAQILDGRLSINNAVNLRETGLFNTTLDLPAFAPVGHYRIMAHWFDDNGEHLISQPKTLVVQRGLVAGWIKDTSENQALFFGLICVLVAIVGGLLSEVIFRRFAP